MEPNPPSPPPHPPRSILLPHFADVDGLACVVWARLYGGFDRIFPVDYGFEEDPETVADLMRYDKIILADISCSEEFFLLLKNAGKDVRIFDHHDSSSWAKAYPENSHDETRSGARIFVEDYYGKKRLLPAMNQFKLLVDTYDRFVTGSPLWEEAKNLNRVFFSYAAWGQEDALDRHDTFIRVILEKFNRPEKFFWTVKEEQAIVKAKNREMKALQDGLASIQIRRSVNGLTFAVMKFGAKISLVAHKILHESSLTDTLDYIVVVNDYGNKLGHISGRSRDEEKFKVNTLYPFKGHPCAAACDLSPEDALFLYNNPVGFALRADMPDEENLDGDEIDPPQIFILAETLDVEFQVYFKEGQNGL